MLDSVDLTVRTHRRTQLIRSTKMPRLTCGCLNVKVYAKRVEHKIVNVQQLGIGNEATEEFFSLNIAEALLDLEGIRTEQLALVKQHVVSGWRIHQCSNCEMLTHATYGADGHNKLLINLSLKSDPTIIESLEKSPDFSPLYKLVLHSGANDNQSRSSMLGLQSEKYDQTQRTLSTIQDQLTKFIDSEKNAMEERIRLYEEQQQAVFAALESKARREKNALLNQVLAAQDGGHGDSLSSMSLHGPISPLGNERQTVMSPDSVDGPPRTLYNPLHTSNRDLKETGKVPCANLPPKPRDDDLFDLDDLNEDDTGPFYTSDDENEDTDDSSMTEEVPFSNQRYSSRQSRVTVYSSSVPISVPNNWRATNIQDALGEEDDDRVPAPDMEDMAASIKALARSVHTGDGTELFGDLPRRRLNTMEMGKL